MTLNDLAAILETDCTTPALDMAYACRRMDDHGATDLLPYLLGHNDRPAVVQG